MRIGNFGTLKTREDNVCGGEKNLIYSRFLWYLSSVPGRAYFLENVARKVVMNGLKVKALTAALHRGSIHNARESTPLNVGVVSGFTCGTTFETSVFGMSFLPAIEHIYFDSVRLAQGGADVNKYPLGITNLVAGNVHMIELLLLFRANRFRRNPSAIAGLKRNVNVLNLLKKKYAFWSEATRPHFVAEKVDSPVVDSLLKAGAATGVNTPNLVGDCAAIIRTLLPAGVNSRAEREQRFCYQSWRTIKAEIETRLCTISFIFTPNANPDYG